MTLSLKMGPYWSAHDLNVSHECFGGISNRLPIIGFPGFLSFRGAKGPLFKLYLEDLEAI
jgi:hypothetical protein